MDYEACHQAIFMPAINKANHNVHRFLDERGFLYKRGPQNEQVNSCGELKGRAGDGGFFVWNWEGTMALGARGNPQGGIQRINSADYDQRNYDFGNDGRD